MILAGMIRTDETALLCDLAETYGIFEYRALPLTTVAALASGLREDARIRMKIEGRRLDTRTTLMAAAVDRLATLVWMQTKDGAKNRNRPESILARLAGAGTEEREENTLLFETPAAFEAARRSIIEEG